MNPTTTVEPLAVLVAGRVESFSPSRGGTIGAHRFCDIVLDDPEGELPPMAATFNCQGGIWSLTNASHRYLVLHTDGFAPLSVPPRARVTLTGEPFVLSVPGKATAAEVPVWFGSGASAGSGARPWLPLAGVAAPSPPVSAAPVGTVTSRRRATLIVALAVVVMLVASAGAAALVERGHEASASRPEHPTAWDPRVADLVAFVEKDRELTFTMPVYVDFLSPEAFEANVGGEVSEISDEDRQELDRAVGLLRAIGLLEGDVDLLDRITQLQSEGTLAFYDPRSERVSVRGTELTEQVRATLVHELTHALQDQHFGLDRLETDDHSRLRAVAEGDANRTEGHWVDQLAPDARAAHDAGQEAASDGADLTGIPEVLLVLFGSPYELGRGLVETLAAVGGHPAVDRALATPPASDEQLLDPYRYLARDTPVAVAEPALHKGEKRLEGNDAFGSLTLFLMLAQRLDVRQALRAVDGWAGDNYVNFERDGRVCTRVALRGDQAAETDELAGALDAWVGTMPPGAASAARRGDGVEFEACDQGAGFKMGEPRFRQAMSYPTARNVVALGFIRQGLPSELGRCMAGGLLEEMEPDVLLSDGALTAAQKRTIEQVAVTCRR